jgi:ABC-type multidrug transport system ATPase subunit
MIELVGVTRRYGRKGAGIEALRDVSITLSAGRVWAVVGPNGAGKSTLLSVLLGFIRPSEGTVTIAGEAPRDYLREHGAGYLPERFNLPPRWRTGEALRMMARLERTNEDDAERAIELMDLGAHLDRQSAELSRGMLQRVGLAQALLARRSLIVLDEPTEGLDPVWRVRLRDVVSELRSQDRTIVIASHDLSELERIADHALVLDGGAVREVLDVRALEQTVEYRLRLAAPSAHVMEAFPKAERRDELQYVVTVAGPAELSLRLGGFIELGGVVAAVEPVRADLEERVRTALDGER